MVPRCVPRNAESATASTGIPVLDHSKNHTDTPALPFCHLLLKARKPKNSAYLTEVRTLGDHVRLRRLEMGLTQPQLAALLGVDKMTINNWETVRQTPSLRLTPLLIELLGCVPFKNPLR
jgi:DNA-binding XRE family transcriptional regulator